MPKASGTGISGPAGRTGLPRVCHTSGVVVTQAQTRQSLRVCATDQRDCYLRCHAAMVVADSHRFAKLRCRGPQRVRSLRLWTSFGQPVLALVRDSFYRLAQPAQDSQTPGATFRFNV